MLSQNKYHASLLNLFENLNNLQLQIEQYDDLPSEISDWLGQLKLLKGIPLNYLVPDEKMLPPESIRFFYIDSNWINALEDGAFSIGRSLDTQQRTNSFKVDKASIPMVNKESENKAATIRSNYLGLEEKNMDMAVMSGFLLRSLVVIDYPGLGVNAYSKGNTPSATESGISLNILRMEKLSPDSDVLFCLFDGHVHQVDIHEPPEALHYGINSYKNEDGNPSGKKTICPFKTEEDSSITMQPNQAKVIKLDHGSIFRKGDGARTINMAALAQRIGEELSHEKSINAAEMGFEMIEGVGMVSFCNKID